MSTSKTILEMTLEILQAMQSDEVASINDTAESKAVATCIQRTYLDLFGLEDLPEHYSLFKLTATSAATPTLMTIPSGAMKVKWVKYNRETVDITDDTWVLMDFQCIEDGLNSAHLLRQGSSNVESFSYTFNPLGTDPISWYYRNDFGPTWYTSPDDYNLLFDSYDKSLETSLSASRTLAYGLIDPTFTLTDGFTPDLDARQFAMLFNEAKAQAFVEIKQTQNAKADQRARRLMINTQATKNRVPDQSALSRLPNYGRK